jgi:adenylate cyclase, class 2
MRNVELKAWDLDPAASLAAARAAGAEDHGVLWQRDTYFPVAQGRLKLREQDPGGAHLIHYLRADQRGERLSQYEVADVPAPAALAGLLGRALGAPSVVIVKHRHLLTWERVRIHLDRVERLGSFVELEAVLDENEPPDAAGERLARLRRVLSISADRIVASGYAGLLRDSVADATSRARQIP